MSRVPRVLPTSLGPTLAGAGDELTRLEAQRNQLLTKIASEERENANLILWLRVVMVPMVAVIAWVLLLSDHVSAIGFVCTVVIGSLLIFILTLRVRIFGTPYHIGLLALFALLLGLGSGGLVGVGPSTILKPNDRDLLADCEAKISRLKENRS
jgi:hypothetical protein